MLLLALLLMISLWATADDGGESSDVIVIDGDIGFTEDNGVVAGTGLRDDPYIISGETLETSAGPAMLIRHTGSHFTIENLTIRGTNRHSTIGIMVQNAPNGVISRVVLEDLGTGICLQDTLHPRVLSVTIRRCEVGIDLMICPRAEMRGVSITGGGAGILVHHSKQTLIADSTITGCERSGISVVETLGVNISRVTVLRCGLGVDLLKASNSRVLKCTLRDNDDLDLMAMEVVKLEMTGTVLGPRGILVTNFRSLAIDPTNTVNGSTLWYLEGASDISISDNVGQAILKNCRNVSVSNALIHDVAYPIQVVSSDGCRLDNIVTIGSVVGVGFTDGRNNSVTRCSFIDAGSDRITTSAVEVNGEHGLTIEDCTIMRGIDEGLRVTGSDQIVIRNVSVSHFAEGGIYLDNPRAATGGASGSVEISSSLIAANGGYGLKAHSSRLTVTETSFEENPGFAVLCDGTESAIVARCTFLDNPNSLTFRKCDQVSVTSTTILNTDFGIDSHLSPTTILETEITNATVGIVIDKCSGGRVDKVTLKVIATTGILVQGSEDVAIENCSVEGPLSGVLVESSRSCKVLSTVVAEAANGLVIANSWYCNVTKCTFTHCSSWGIVLSSGGGNLLYHNNLIDNNQEGGGSMSLRSQGFDSSEGSSWDDGNEGNFWSDYLVWYGNASRIGRTWTVPYAISGDAGSHDNRPLNLQVDYTPPTADAGKDLTVCQGERFSLDGRASFDDVGIVSYTWEVVIDGEVMALCNVTPCVVLDLPGRFLFTLIVEDAWGNEGRDTMHVEVLDTHPPEVELLPRYEVSAGRPFTIGGYHRCDPSGIVAFRWTIDPQGLGIVLLGPVLEATLNSIGTYPLELHVTDGVGNSRTYHTSLLVRDMTPPTADAGPDLVVDQHEEFVLDGGGSFDNVGIVEWCWSYTSEGDRIVIEGCQAPITLHLAGVYSLRLKVLDDGGNAGIDELSVTVRDIEPPVLHVPEQLTVPIGSIAWLRAEGSCDNIGIVSLSWEVHLQCETVALEGWAVPINFPSPGSFEVDLHAQDEAGNTATARIVVHVVDVTSPVAIVSGPTEARCGSEFVLSGCPSWDDCGIVSYVWWIEIDDEVHRVEGVDIKWTFSLPGSATFTLEVTDAAGNTDRAVRKVRITDPVGPYADAGADRTVQREEVITLNGMADGEAHPTWTYRWRYHSGSDLISLHGPCQELVFQDPGVFSITLIVEDLEGNVAVDLVHITVLEEPTLSGPGPERMEAPGEGTDRTWLARNGWWLIELVLALSLIGTFWYLVRDPRRKST
jgi:parallel beta-helix repeat protein